MADKKKKGAAVVAAPKWMNRIVGYGVKPARDFLANIKNWRIHPKSQRDALTGSLLDVGWVAPVVENIRTGNLIDGHARVEEALKLGDDTPVPFVQVDLTQEEEDLILATLDPISAMAAADRDQLDTLLRDVSTGNEALMSMLANLAEKNGITPSEPKDAPEEFPTYDEDIETQYCCPKCAYKWSGKPQ